MRDLAIHAAIAASFNPTRFKLKAHRSKRPHRLVASREIGGRSRSDKIGDRRLIRISIRRAYEPAYVFNHMAGFGSDLVKAGGDFVIRRREEFAGEGVRQRRQLLFPIPVLFALVAHGALQVSPTRSSARRMRRRALS